MKGLQVREDLHLKRLFNDRAILGMERSVQFNLCPLATACITENAPSVRTKATSLKPSSKGGLAQLVERLLCKQNVNGSNPLTSTTRKLIVKS